MGRSCLVVYMVGFSSAKVSQRNQNVVEAMDVQQQQCTTNHDVAGFVPRKCWTTCLESLRMFKIFLDSTVLLHSTTTTERGIACHVWISSAHDAKSRQVFNPQTCRREGKFSISFRKGVSGDSVAVVCIRPTTPRLYGFSLRETKYQPRHGAKASMARNASAGTRDKLESLFQTTNLWYDFQ